MNLKKMLLVATLAALPMLGTAGPVRFRLDIFPVGGVVSPDAQLYMWKTAGFTTQSYELEDGAGAYLGTVQVGIDIDTKIGYLDLLVGGGVLAMPLTGDGVETFPIGGALTGEVAYRFKLNKRGTVTIGPFIGFMMPTDATFELEDETGMGDDVDEFDLISDGGGQAGVKFTAGGKNVCFSMKAGYTVFGYEVESNEDPGWNISYGDDDQLDMTGFFAQFGLGLQF
ncbi:hypothetical protein P4B35_05190 [Pontiellaceae bacterium B12227]|nr:hypothetical protein [Pontiellaceae bacterium B12227]